MKNLWKYCISVFVVSLITSIIPADGTHGLSTSIRIVTIDESFDRNKDVPIQFKIINSSEKECLLVSSAGVGLTEVLPEISNTLLNFTMPYNAEIPPNSNKIFTVNAPIYPDMSPGEYTYRIFATVGSCSEPDHRLDFLDGPRFGLKVDPPKNQCIIATATYGSELAPEVQFLRNFRDNTVLSTYSGSNFMTLFNAFYYSWSPEVADTIRDNDGLKSISKVMITPLLGILKISLVAGENETGVITFGILSSMLIGAVYVTPLSIGSLTALKRDVRKHHIKYALLIWVSAVVLTVGAGILHVDMFMMVSAGVLVLSSIVLSTMGLTFAIKRLVCRRI